MKQIVKVIILFFIFNSCDTKNESNETIKWSNDYKLIYNDDILIDSSQFKENKKNGKSFQFTLDGKPLSMSWYKNGKKHGISITYHYKNNKVTKVFFKEGIRHGSSVVENEAGDTLAYDYYLKDSLRFSSLFSSELGFKIESGRVFVSSFDNNNDSISIGDTLSINVFMIPVPHTRINFCIIKNNNKPTCYDSKFSNPFIYSELVKDKGEQRSIYLFNVVDTISGKSIDKFKISLAYEAL